MDPLISFVIPTLDRPALLAYALRSLRAQTLPAWEAVVVCDGSACDGGTSALADDPRIRVLARGEPPAGANRCRNVGVANARSDLIVFLDDDDLLSETCAEARVTFMEAHPHLDFAVFPHRRFSAEPGDCDSTSIPHDGDDHIEAYLAVRIPWQTAGPVWRRSFLHRVGAWDESLPCWQDWEMMVRALSLGPSYACVPGPCFWHRIPTVDRGSISTRGATPDRMLAQERAIRSGWEALRARGLLTRRRRKLLARLHLAMAERWVRVGRADRARETWRQACERGLASRFAARLGGFLLERARSRVVSAALRRAVWIAL